jgi:hypothetical protein
MGLVCRHCWRIGYIPRRFYRSGASKTQRLATRQSTCYLKFSVGSRGRCRRLARLLSHHSRASCGFQVKRKTISRPTWIGLGSGVLFASLSTDVARHATLIQNLDTPIHLWVAANRNSMDLSIARVATKGGPGRICGWGLLPVRHRQVLRLKSQKSIKSELAD